MIVLGIIMGVTIPNITGIVNSSKYNGIKTDATKMIDKAKLKVIKEKKIQKPQEKQCIILTLNQPHFFNLYQLNINHKKVHTLPYNYFAIEKLKIDKLNCPLYVINIGGNHIPTKRQIKIESKIMEKRYPFFFFF